MKKILRVYILLLTLVATEKLTGQNTNSMPLTTKALLYLNNISSPDSVIAFFQDSFVKYETEIIENLFIENKLVESLADYYNHLYYNINNEDVSLYGCSNCNNFFHLLERYLDSQKYINMDWLTRSMQICNDYTKKNLKRNANLIQHFANHLNTNEAIYVYNNIDSSFRIYLVPTLTTYYNPSIFNLELFWNAIDHNAKNNFGVYYWKTLLAKSQTTQTKKDSITEQIRVQLEAIKTPGNAIQQKTLDASFYNKPDRLFVDRWRRVQDSFAIVREREKERFRNMQLDSFILTIDSKNAHPRIFEIVEYLRDDDIELEDYDMTKWLNPTANEIKVYRAYSDTTLYDKKETYRPYLNGDDAMRFDTLTDDQLFAALATINIGQLVDSIKLSHQFNQSTAIIHLRKITQLLGDRQIAHTLTIKPSQQVQIDRLLDFIESKQAKEPNDLWEPETRNLLFRLWFLAYPRIKSWIESPNRNLRNSANDKLHYFADEALVIEYINKFNAAAAIRDQDTMIKYLTPLSFIDSFKDPDRYTNNLPPRRHASRSYEQSYDWCDKYIYPAMKVWYGN